MVSRSFGAEPLAGPVKAAIPGRGQIAGSLVATEKLAENTHVELPHLADVIRLVELVQQGMNIGQQGNGGQVALFVLARVDDLPSRCGRVVECPGKGRCLALVHPHVLLEAEAFAIGKQQRFREQERRARQHGRILRGRHLLLDEIHHLRVFYEAHALRFQNVVHHDGRGLALYDGLARCVHLVLGQVVGVAGGVERDIVRGLVAPLFQAGVLVLQGVGQLVGEHRLLLLNVHPIQHIYGLVLGVVIGLDLLFEQRQQKRLEGEVAVQQAELFEHDLIALQAPRALVLLELPLEVIFHGCAGSDLALHLTLDGQPGFVGGKLDERIHQGKELALLLGGDLAGYVRWSRLRPRRGYGGRLLGLQNCCRKTQHRRYGPSASISYYHRVPLAH